MTDPAVVITGLGIISPLGLALREVAERFCAGQSALRPLSDLGVEEAVGATVDEIPVDVIPADRRSRIGRLDRLCRLFLSAAYAAVAAAKLSIDDADADRVALSFGTGLGCLLTNAEYNQKMIEHGPAAASPRLFAYTVSSAAAGEASIALGIKGANVTSHAGLAAGLQAIGYGFDLIRMGKAEVVLAGGADALGQALVRGLADMHVLKPRAAQPFHAPAAGVCPAEGAAVVVLERRDRARRRGARVLARVDGYAAGFEPTLSRRRRECRAIVETMRRALTLSGRAARDIGLVMASAHATALDAVELAALQTVLADASAPVLCAPKAAWGETFGADGALAVGLATALLDQPARPADDVVFGLDGAPLQGDDAQARLQRAQLALIHALCYSGATVTLVLAREN
jgi:3-oxoacyl-[acyl-carrier-protein] synthase II